MGLPHPLNPGLESAKKFANLKKIVFFIIKIIEKQMSKNDKVYIFEKPFTNRQRIGCLVYPEITQISERSL